MGSKFAWTALLLFVLGFVGLGYATPSAAAIAPEGATALLRGYGLDGGGCDCEKERAELAEMRARIAAAGSVDEARELSLDQTGLARKALSRAKWVVPFNGAIKQASGKLDAYEVQVQAAQSPEEVAAAFGGLVRLASADDLKVVDAHLFEKRSGCDYTTGEIIIIVIGFLLGIIPGFIFLAVFC
ncbi:MAG: hypothetical protein Q8R92_17690 [Deltaproteobacteria bacterium]|nr:hypothetical protein [Deltaproteobacteria bacterium]